MKTIKTILIALATICILVGCKKDEDGQWIRYYEKPTGEGYVFVKNDDGTITPFANKKDCIALEASGNAGGGLFDAFWEHTDIYSTDENGKFTCKFVRKIDRHDVQYYRIYIKGVRRFDKIEEWIGYYCIPKNFSENKIINIDTIFVTLY